jgi:hypothetical protein
VAIDTGASNQPVQAADFDGWVSIAVIEVAKDIDKFCCCFVVVL